MKTRSIVAVGLVIASSSVYGCGSSAPAAAQVTSSRLPGRADHMTGFATDVFGTSDSPFEPSQPTIDAMDRSSHSPLSPAGRNRVLTDDERVHAAEWRSLLASDPSPWIFSRERYPHAHQDDPDGGDNRERARRQRHID